MISDLYGRAAAIFLSTKMDSYDVTDIGLANEGAVQAYEFINALCNEYGLVSADVTADHWPEVISRTVRLLIILAALGISTDLPPQERPLPLHRCPPFMANRLLLPWGHRFAL